MGFEYMDLIYANPPPPGRLSVSELVAAMGDLVSSGTARAWGLVNWDAIPFLEASVAAASHGVPQPCAVQLPYSLVRRDWLETPGMRRARQASGAGVVASSRWSAVS
jgi:aryl-alcohol dehydrogenase-like predicted oxidoreductase